MKVLIASDTYEYQISGATNSIIALRNELREMGHDVRALVLSPNNKSYYKNGDYYIASKAIPIYPGARFSFKVHDKLIEEILEWEPDIVHLQSEFSSRILANRIIGVLNIPFVTTCHAVYEDYTNYFCPSKKLGRTIVKHCSRKFYNGAKTLIVPSEKLKKIEKGYGVKCPIEVVPTGISLGNYQKELPEREKRILLAKYGIRESDKCLVSVSRLAKEKNIDEILKYMPALVRENEAIKLILVGDGPNKKRLVKKVKQMNLQSNVIFIGMVPPEEVYKYYQLGMVFVSASTSESQGLVYLEALASGLPMICKEDECLDGVLENSVNGYIFNNEREFVKSVFAIIQDEKKAKRMGLYSLKRSDEFDVKGFANKIENIYQRALSA